ncbi:hypothetical protein [Agrococcus baldri]|uniref:Uncharacterized protein n=1 Tax=Agrococcus baldri TaxID=153730 RepID=A0AA87US24_9MICO|nr:hypothetical protein [Agrococcus baldri]GEK80473.1 hypothetical protein ABA31_18240 [Agrococcus baldri]
MLAMLATIGRALAQHWPALVALHLGGVLARYALIELAGWVGAYTAVGGLLILPLAVLARLAAFVGMFLVLRASLRQLSAIAPPPASPLERRRAFIASLLGGVLPFFAVYMATGNVQQDVDAYAARALEVLSTLRLEAAFGDGPEVNGETVLDVALGWPALVAIGIALAGRWAWGRWEQRLPRWVAIVAVYLEGVWVFLSVLLIGDLLDAVRAWVDERQAMVWVADARAWLAESVAPAAWLWDGVDWVLAEIAGAIGQPLAWLTIAGVMYGQAVAAQAPALSHRLRGTRLGSIETRVTAARSRYGALPSWLRVQLRRLWAPVAARLSPIWRALVLMLRGGPLLFGATVLLYALLVWFEGGLSWATTRMVGANDFFAFWAVWDVLLLLPVAVIVESLRVVIVAGAYDAMIGRLRRQEAAAADERSATEETDASARDALTGGGPALTGPAAVAAGEAR